MSHKLTNPTSPSARGYTWGDYATRAVYNWTCLECYKQLDQVARIMIQDTANSCGDNFDYLAREAVVKRFGDHLRNFCLQCVPSNIWGLWHEILVNTLKEEVNFYDIARAYINDDIIADTLATDRHKKPEETTD